MIDWTLIKDEKESCHWGRESSFCYTSSSLLVLFCGHCICFVYFRVNFLALYLYYTPFIYHQRINVYAQLLLRVEFLKWDFITYSLLIIWFQCHQIWFLPQIIIAIRGKKIKLCKKISTSKDHIILKPNFNSSKAWSHQTKSTFKIFKYKACPASAPYSGQAPKRKARSNLIKRSKA